MSPEEEKVINRNTMKLQDHLYKALKQRDQYKAECDTLIDDIKELRDLNEALKVSESVNWHSSREFEQERNELEKENKHLKERINKAEELIEGNIETLKMYGGIISKNYELEKENKEYLKTMKLQAEKISRLERELEAALNGELSTYDELLKYVMELQSELMEYQKENEELYNIANKAMDIAESENEKYIKLTQHIRLKAENNPGVSRYIDLVNYIDRLERADDEKI